MGDCPTIAADTASATSPLPFWGKVDCADSSRVTRLTGGADPHPAASGAAQPDNSYRQLTVMDGDNVNRNSPTALYREGQRRVTYASIRLPDSFPLDANTWQAVLQMKQAQPADGGGGTPVLALHAFDGAWRFYQSDSNGPSGDTHELWSAPAAKNTWTRFAFDITYSQDPSKGKIQISADLNGDGDFSDAGEQSPVMTTYTLKYEVDGPNGTSDGLAPGQSIPSHLRMGNYHNPSISCPPPLGCQTDVDNVEVVKP